MDAIKFANVGLRFLLELCILVIFGYWGFKTGGPAWARALLGLGSPLLFVVVWGVWLAPKSAQRLPEPWLFLLELALFALAVLALRATGKLPLAVAFAAVYIVNKLLMVLWRQS